MVSSRRARRRQCLLELSDEWHLKKGASNDDRALILPNFWVYHTSPKAAGFDEKEHQHLPMSYLSLRPQFLNHYALLWRERLVLWTKDLFHGNDLFFRFTWYYYLPKIFQGNDSENAAGKKVDEECEEKSFELRYPHSFYDQSFSRILCKSPNQWDSLRRLQIWFKFEAYRWQPRGKKENWAIPNAFRISL